MESLNNCSSRRRLAFFRKIQISVIILVICVYLLYMFTSVHNCFKGIYDYQDFIFRKNASDLKTTFDNDDAYVEEIDKGCQPHTETCFHKCCPDSFSLKSSDNLHCALDEELNDTQFVSSVISFLDDVNSTLLLYQAVIEVDVCYNYELEDSHARFDYGTNVSSLLKNSLLFQDKYFSNIFISSICFDFIAGTNNLVLWVCIENISFMAYEQTVDNILSWSTLLEFVTLCCSISTVLANFAIMFVYIYVPQLQQPQGKIIVSFLKPKTASHCYIIILQIIDMLLWDISLLDPFRDLNHTILLAWMSWLTVMCYDIWDKFSCPLYFTYDSLSFKKFLLYSLFGWGWPAIHMIYTTTGLYRMCIYPLYYFTPNFNVTIALNFVLFISTLFNLRFHHHTTRLDSNVFRRHGEYQDSILLYIRLAILMGFDWLLAIVLDIYSNKHLNDLIFILQESQSAILVYNPRVMNLLPDKWNST